MRKLRKNEGFTLAELLIVVAIIAVLVAVSIPIFTSQLEKSRENTDIANFRAAKAAAVTKILDATATSGTYKYDAQAGILVEDSTNINGYGKGTPVKGNTGDAPAGYDYGADYTNGVVKITFNEKGATMQWYKNNKTVGTSVNVGEEQVTG